MQLSQQLSSTTQVKSLNHVLGYLTVCGKKLVQVANIASFVRYFRCAIDLHWERYNNHRFIVLFVRLLEFYAVLNWKAVVFMYFFVFPLSNIVHEFKMFITLNKFGLAVFQSSVSVSQMYSTKKNLNLNWHELILKQLFQVIILRRTENKMNPSCLIKDVLNVYAFT